MDIEKKSRYFGLLVIYHWKLIPSERQIFVHIFIFNNYAAFEMLKNKS